MNIAIESFERVKYLFHREFGSIASRFKLFNLGLGEARDSKDPEITKPGVYVFWSPSSNVIKVGRHLVNSRKRAFEHIRDNTGAEMGKLEEDDNARLFLLNIQYDEDLHWVAALEIFFERELRPSIRSKRLG